MRKLVFGCIRRNGGYLWSSGWLFRWYSYVEVKSCYDFVHEIIGPTLLGDEEVVKGGWGIDCPGRHQSKLSEDNFFACFGLFPEPVLISAKDINGGSCMSAWEWVWKRTRLYHTYFVEWSTYMVGWFWFNDFVSSEGADDGRYITSFP